MKRTILRLLASLALLLAGLGAQAQSTHLGVSAKKIVKLVYTGFYDPSTSTFSQGWSENLNGAFGGVNGGTFTIPKGKTLVVTDVEATLRCQTAVPSLPNILLQVSVVDGAGTTVAYLPRFLPTRMIPGYEHQRASLTAGTVVPSGQSLVVEPEDPASLSSHYLRRCAIWGYYAD